MHTQNDEPMNGVYVCDVIYELDEVSNTRHNKEHIKTQLRKGT
jgi:hypothetical protein